MELAEKKAKQEELARQEELAKQKALTKPKPMLPTSQASVQPIANKQAFPMGQVNFGAPQSVPSSMPVAKTIETKPLSSDRSQSSFGFPTDKSTSKVDSSTGPFNVAATSTSFFGAKPGGTGSPSIGFQFGGVLNKTTASVSPQIKPADVPTATKPIGMTASIPEKAPPKPALLATPTNISTTQTPLMTSIGNNLNQKSGTRPTPLLATPSQPPILSSAPAVTAPATSSTFKFDVANAFSSAADQSKNDKENKPMVSAVPLARTSSTTGFSFPIASGANVSVVAAAKPSTPAAATVQAELPKSNAAAPISASIVSPFSTPTSSATPPKSSAIGLSFAKASAEASIFSGGATTITNVSTPTSNAAVSSTTDPTSIFQSFNTCKPNVADNSSCKLILFEKRIEFFKINCMEIV